MKRSHNNKGFSLIELLTVIAIIAILAAVIFPVMSSVKDRARQQQCMTNLHQIAIGVQMFKTDNRRYPLILGSEVYGPADTNGQRTKWVDAQTTPEMFENVKDQYLFAEYVKTIAGFHCPSSQVTRSNDVVLYDASSPGGQPIAVYAYDSYDCFVIGPGADQGGYSLYRESDGNVERHYILNWATSVDAVAGLPPYPPGKIADTPELQKQDYARQLRFRNPPADTLVTWCAYHEGASRNGKALVVFLDGTASSIPATEVNQSRWRIRPKKS